MSLLKKLSNYKNQVNFEEGMKKTIYFNNKII